MNVVREHSVGKPDCNLGFDPYFEMAIDVVFHPFRRACAATIVAPIPK